MPRIVSACKYGITIWTGEQWNDYGFEDENVGYVYVSYNSFV